jgi:hypothetical protein
MARKRAEVPQDNDENSKNNSNMKMNNNNNNNNQEGRNLKMTELFRKEYEMGCW